MFVPGPGIDLRRFDISQGPQREVDACASEHGVSLQGVLVVLFPLHFIKATAAFDVQQLVSVLARANEAGGITAFAMGYDVPVSAMLPFFRGRTVVECRSSSVKLVDAAVGRAYAVVITRAGLAATRAHVPSHAMVPMMIDMNVRAAMTYLSDECGDLTAACTPIRLCIEATSLGYSAAWSNYGVSWMKAHAAAVLCVLSLVLAILAVCTAYLVVVVRDALEHWAIEPARVYKSCEFRRVWICLLRRLVEWLEKR